MSFHPCPLPSAFGTTKDQHKLLLGIGPEGLELVLLCGSGSKIRSFGYRISMEATRPPRQIDFLPVSLLPGQMVIMAHPGPQGPRHLVPEGLLGFCYYSVPTSTLEAIKFQASRWQSRMWLSPIIRAARHSQFRTDWALRSCPHEAGFLTFIYCFCTQSPSLPLHAL